MYRTFTGFLFDMDGTLVDSTEAVKKTWLDFSQKYNLDFNEVIEFAHGRRTSETVTHFLGDSPASYRISKFIERKEVHNTDNITAIPGAKKLLNFIHSSHWTIVTSANKELAQRRLLAAGLPCPEMIISSEDVKSGKPNPEGYLLGAKLLGLRIEDILIFEDATAGIIAALSSGATLGVIGDCDSACNSEWIKIPDFTYISIKSTENQYIVSTN
ncbi:HAD-IA family hydrolase [Photorhabdus asymbiotica]|uniref:HAD-IA family hydrolase n=1 Tax=Photorhabdus asymbiotica TaxID=291112 RepID=UPI003DA70C6B